MNPEQIVAGAADHQNLLADLRSQRQQLGLTQRQAADRTGYNQSNISAYELGSRQPDLRNLCMYVRGLGLKVVLMLVD
jgi:transcriptional regulator with XRE-family HTH domain